MGLFDSVALRAPQQNTFDLSHDVKLSFRIGELVPTLVHEALPGDVFTIRSENFHRFAPLVSPVFHNVDIKTEFFFVPNRIIWAQWEDWITRKSDVPAPYVSISDEAYPVVGGLWDYMGFPIPDSSDFKPYRVSPLPLAAYFKIWNEYYRHQHLEDEDPKGTVEFGDNTTLFESTLGPVIQTRPLVRAWQRDYFTSCLPDPQQGADPVQLPLTEQLNIPVDWGPVEAATPKWAHPNTGLPTPDGNVISDGGDARISTSGEPKTSYDPDGTLTVDVQAGATTIERLRQAFKMQEFLEKSLRGGLRYAEQIWSHFRKKSSDARLQRPELIGSAWQRMVISEVLSTAQTDSDAGPAAIGQMAGHGISVGGSGSLRYDCEEHGWIIGITSATPRTAYQQGLNRMFTRFDPFDYAWPSFANLGEQEVKYKEVQAHIPAAATAYDLENTFGYQMRYADYKTAMSRVSGQFRTTLAHWHMGRIFDDLPNLNADFVKCYDIDGWNRVFAVTDETEDHIYAMIQNNVYVKRKLPRFGIPSLMPA